MCVCVCDECDLIFLSRMGDNLLFKEKREKLRDYSGSSSPYSPKRLRKRQRQRERERERGARQLFLIILLRTSSSEWSLFLSSFPSSPPHLLFSFAQHPPISHHLGLFVFSSVMSSSKNLYGVSIGPSSRLNVPWDWGWSDAGTRLSLVLFPLVGCVLEHLLSPVNGENRTLNSGLGGH